MKLERERSAVLSLLRWALGRRAEVRFEADGSLRVTRPDEEPVHLRLEDLAEERLAQGAGPGTLWILRGSADRLRERLRDERQSFVDPTRGAVYLDLAGILVDRTDISPGESYVRSAEKTRNPFSDRASMVPRILFVGGAKKEWTVTSLAREANVAAATVSYVVRALAERELVQVRRDWREQRIRLTDRRKLIEAWTQAYTWTSNDRHAFHAPVGSPSRFLRRLPRMLSGVDWALTLQAGASVVARHARWDRIHLYIDSRSSRSAEQIGIDLDWTPSNDGEVVLLRPHYGTAIWPGVREASGLPVVSDLQLILDLWHYPLRGREQAEILLEMANRHDGGA